MFDLPFLLVKLVGIDDGRGQAVVRRSFVRSGPLEDYAHEVQLLKNLRS